MQKEIKLWQFIAKRLRDKEKVVLLIVAESLGSSPGRQGFKMVIGEDGNFFGSIGGGIMEIKMVELAKSLLKKEEVAPLLKKQIHRKDATHLQSGMICSGEQTVLFLPLSIANIHIARAMIRCLKTDETATLTIVHTADNQSIISIVPQALTSTYHFTQQENAAYTYQESLGYQHRLYIVGGGHCSLALSELMLSMDFHITVLDDRAELDTLTRNKFAHRITLLDDYLTIGDHIPSGANVYIVIMTVGYRTDDIVVRQLLGKSVNYLGLLGSKHKIATLLEQLRLEQYSEEHIGKLHAPIGLPIHSRTPEEIAVSIAAEIIQVKNQHHSIPNAGTTKI